MSEWKQKGAESAEWRLELPKDNCVKVLERSNADGHGPWGLYVSVTGYAFDDSTDCVPFRNALIHAAELLKTELALIEILLLQSIPTSPVDFPAAVDPVAAIERG